MIYDPVSGGKLGRATPKDLTDARALAAWEVYCKTNKTYRELGKEFGGVSSARARQLVYNGERIARKLELVKTNPWYELSSRARNCLHNAGCEPSLDSVQKQSVIELRHTPNLGKGTIAEIQKWLIRHDREPLEEPPVRIKTKIQDREKALHTALWKLINSMDAIAEIANGHSGYRINLATAIERASQEADAYSHVFPAEGEWRPQYEPG